MIVNLRGTNGTGKTYAVRQVLGAVYQADPQAIDYIPSAKDQGGFRAGHYRIINRRSARPLIVLGCYGGAASGGVDQYPSTLMVEAAVRRWHSEQCDVLYEGLLISHLQARWMAVARDCAPHWFLYLEKTAELCIADTERRRAECGNMRPLNPKNLLGKYRATERCCQVMREAGLLVERVAPEEAAAKVWTLLEGAPYRGAFPPSEVTIDWLIQVDARARIDPAAAASGAAAAVDERQDLKQLSLL